jgi:hypothetical protein
MLPSPAVNGRWFNKSDRARSDPARPLEGAHNAYEPSVALARRSRREIRRRLSQVPARPDRRRPRGLVRLGRGNPRTGRPPFQARAQEHGALSSRKPHRAGPGKADRPRPLRRLILTCDRERRFCQSDDVSLGDGMRSHIAVQVVTCVAEISLKAQRWAEGACRRRMALQGGADTGGWSESRAIRPGTPACRKSCAIVPFFADARTRGSFPHVPMQTLSTRGILGGVAKTVTQVPEAVPQDCGWYWQPVGESNPSFQVENLAS